MVCLALLGRLGRVLLDGRYPGNGVSNIREHQLEEALQGEKWKQALALCEKRIKKGERDDVMIVRPTACPPNLTRNTDHANVQGYESCHRSV